MSFKVTFESDLGSYDARMTREQAVAWLESRGFGGLVTPATGLTTPLADFDDDALATAVAAAAFDLVREIAGHDGVLNVRNEPDDEPRSRVTIGAKHIHAVRVIPPSRETDEDDPDDDSAAPLEVGLGFPFGYGDSSSVH